MKNSHAHKSATQESEGVRFRGVINIAAWIAAFSGLLAMLIGHLGDHDLSWKSNFISTFAARAPYDSWISSSMVISAIALICISLQISREKALGNSYITHTIPIVTGGVVSGLLMLAFYEETASSLDALKRSEFDLIRQQTFHDAGLMLFFYGSLLLVCIAGLSCTIFRSRRFDKLLGITIAGSGPASFLLMATRWPELLGVTGPSGGLRQRASLFCIWLAMILLLKVIRPLVGTDARVDAAKGLANQEEARTL